MAQVYGLVPVSIKPLPDPMLTSDITKLFGFHRTEDRFWLDFADIKHDYTQEFYRSYSSFISQCPKTGKLSCVCDLSSISYSEIHLRSVSDSQLANKLQGS